MIRSLRGSVAATVIVAVALTLALVLLIVVSTFAANEREGVDRDLLARADATLAAAKGPPPRRGQRQPPPVATSLARRVEQSVAQGGESARLIDGGGVFDTFGAAVPQAGFPAPRGTGEIQTVTVGGVRYRAVAFGVDARVDAGGRRTMRLEIAKPLAEAEQSIADLRRRVLLAGIGGLVLATVAAVLLGRLALRALERLRERIAIVRDPELPDARLARGGPAEVDDVAATVNEMLDRIAASGAARTAALEASRRFAADAGHELRTPLTAIAANIATLRAHPELGAAERAPILAALADDEARLTALLDALQALARADAAEAVPREPVDVAGLADAAVLAARRRHPGCKISLAAPPDDAATVLGWGDGLRLAIDNLIQNALVHGGGRPVAVTVAVAPDAAVSVTVDDAGPGIPPEEREAVRGRFVRGATAKGPGSGLGLALVAQQADLHGGTLAIGAAPAGGARVRLRLGPAAAPSPG